MEPKNETVTLLTSHKPQKIDPNSITVKNLFDLPENWFRSVEKEIQKVSLGSSSEIRLSQELEIPKEELKIQRKLNYIPEVKKEGPFTCRTCEWTTLGLLTYQEHYKSEWHKFNLKLKLAGGATISQEEFATMKISEKELNYDSSDEEVQEKNHFQDKDNNSSNQKHSISVSSPKIIFRCSDGTCFSIWKNLLGGNTFVRNSTPQQLINLLPTLKEKTKWSIFLCSGGHFAGGVFEAKKCIKHKTFHRYTTRKKQGGSQSTRDAKGNAPKSAGSYIRRYNETKLKEDIARVLSDWKNEINSSHFIFLYTPGNNKFQFIFEGSILSKNDSRIQSIPFSTRRPTLVEVSRIHQWLSSIEFFKEEPESNNHVELNQLEFTDLLEQESDNEEKSDKEEEEETESEEKNKVDLFLEAIRENDLNLVKQLIEDDYERPVPTSGDEICGSLYLACTLQFYEIAKYLIEIGDDLNIQDPHWHFRTALHRLAFDGVEDLIVPLLEKGGDPTIKDLDGKTPYDIAKNKKIRMIFRRYAGSHPDQFDYEEAHISPLTEEMEAELKQKKMEKQQQKKKEKEEKEKKQREKEQKKKEKEEQQRKLQEEKLQLEKIAKEREIKEANLSERERRALAAERRLASVKLKCSFCEKELTTTPFERLDYKYCSMDCLLKHKRKLEGKK